ncbi:MAG TPA: hypothetical protein H9746_04725 [Candidatus Butyricicoccus avistercoris]|uniref:Uncharacterized protein n=1 Tax=Candidatus Butyricicoccus avistercoris TaxID=2838518 RepID=A0A9D1PIG8_9FIRM|nr:hypothetical protein [Candidatus Butyricicoccus avistercoris]
MGEIIKVLDTIEFAGGKFDVELNHGVNSTEEREIHIQNKSMRLAMPEHEFLQIASAIVLAKKQLDIIKEKDK